MAQLKYMYLAHYELVSTMVYVHVIPPLCHTLRPHRILPAILIQWYWTDYLDYIVCFYMYRILPSNRPSPCKRPPPFFGPVNFKRPWTLNREIAVHVLPKAVHKLLTYTLTYVPDVVEGTRHKECPQEIPPSWTPGCGLQQTASKRQKTKELLEQPGACSTWIVTQISKSIDSPISVHTCTYTWYGDTGACMPTTLIPNGLFTEIATYSGR